MIIHNPILTGSFTVNGTDVSSITSSAASLTSLNAYTASQNILNGTYATTSSNTFAGIQTVNSNLVVTGSITAQTLVVQTITSSVDFVTGSTRFGSVIGNTHVFTGSMSISGSSTFGSSVQINQSASEIQQIINSNSTSNPSITQYKVSNSSGWEVGMANLANSYSYIFSYGSFGTGNAKFTLTSAGAATFASSVTAGAILSTGVSTFSRTGLVFTLNPSYAGGDVYSQLQSTGALALAAGGDNNRLYITSGGLVGIGTSSPSSLLDVSKSTNSGSGSTYPRIQVQNTLTTQGDGSSTFNFADVRIASGNSAVQMFLATSFASGLWEPQGLISVATNHPLIFRTNNAERFRISSGGVATFTSDDASGNRTTINDVLTITQTNGNAPYAGFGSSILFRGTTYTGITRNWGRIGMYLNDSSVSTNGESMYFAVAPADNSDTINTAMTIRYDSNVGIGITNPSTKLSVSGTGNVVSITSSDNSLSLALGYQGTMHGYLGGFSSRLEAYSNNGGYVFLNSSSAWVAASDINRKRNFETYSLGLNAILGLQPKVYNMDFQNDGDEKQVGLIAQEVEQFIPKAFEQSDEFIGLNYNTIIVTMVNAIQELKAEIDELKNK
jgi:hypothetical protein